MSDVPPTGTLLADADVLISANIAGVLSLLGNAGVWTTDEALGETFQVSGCELRAVGINVAMSQSTPERIVGISVKDSALLHDAKRWGCAVGTGDKALLRKCVQQSVEAFSREDLFAKWIKDALESGSMTAEDILAARQKLRDDPWESGWYESDLMQEAWRLAEERTK